MHALLLKLQKAQTFSWLYNKLNFRINCMKMAFTQENNDSSQMISTTSEINRKLTISSVSKASKHF